jgi:hypothetical protein
VYQELVPWVRWELAYLECQVLARWVRWELVCPVFRELVRWEPWVPWVLALREFQVARWGSADFQEEVLLLPLNR